MIRTPFLLGQGWVRGRRLGAPWWGGWMDGGIDTPAQVSWMEERRVIQETKDQSRKTIGVCWNFLFLPGCHDLIYPRWS